MTDLAPIRARFAAVSSELDERGRRLLVAAEARAAGYGGIAAVSAATGMAASTIGRGEHPSWPVCGKPFKMQQLITMLAEQITSTST